MLTHVDDWLHGSGNTDHEDKVIKRLKETFLFGSEEDIVFQYIHVRLALTTKPPSLPLLPSISSILFMV